MLVQFKVSADDSCFMVDTVQMRWTRNAGDKDSSEILELGKLIFVGLQGPSRVFALEGRDMKTEGPGAGLCTFGYAVIDLDTTLVFYMQANVPIKDLISRRPIDTVRYQVVPNIEPGKENTNEGQEHDRPSLAQESQESGSIRESASSSECETREAGLEPGRQNLDSIGE